VDSDAGTLACPSSHHITIAHDFRKKREVLLDGACMNEIDGQSRVNVSFSHLPLAFGIIPGIDH
jgi:hypothetical protein